MTQPEDSRKGCEDKQLATHTKTALFPVASKYAHQFWPVLVPERNFPVERTFLNYKHELPGVRLNWLGRQASSLDCLPVSESEEACSERPLLGKLNGSVVFRKRAGRLRFARKGPRGLQSVLCWPTTRSKQHRSAGPARPQRLAEGNGDANVLSLSLSSSPQPYQRQKRILALFN